MNRLPGVISHGQDGPVRGDQPAAPVAFRWKCQLRSKIGEDKAVEEE